MMTSASDENEKITTVEAALASPPFNDLEGGNELNSLASFAMGDTAIKSTNAREGHPSGTASEMSMKFGATEGLHSFPLSNRLPSCLAGQPLLSPQSISCSHRSTSYVPLEEPHPGYSPIGPVESAHFNETSSDWRCSTTNPGPCIASNCQNGCFNHASVHQGGPPSSAWGVIEEHQERLESLQQAICYCEERSNMGKALRSREAAVRARFLHEQLQQQSHSRQARKERNNSLMNEAVGLCLRKTISPHRPAAERLGACLSALHKHMERSLSSSAFAVASTTPGIGGIRSSISLSLPQKDHEEPQSKSKAVGLKPLNDTSGTSRSTQQEGSGEDEASITKEYSKSSTSILYEGAADALAARELVQTRAKLLLQKQLDNNTSDSLQQLLSLESHVRGQMALLGAGVNHKEQHSGTASGEPANELDDNTSPSIPEETAGLHGHKMLPQSQPQRLIAHSQLRCSSMNTQSGKGMQYQTNVSAKFNDSVGIELPPALGEQQWLNIARQISVLQEMLLRVQHPHRKKKHSDRQHAWSEGSMQGLGHKGVNVADSSIAKSDPLEKEVEKLSSPPARAVETTILRMDSKDSADFSRYVNTRDKAESGRRSAPEERLRRHQLRLQQQIEQRDRGKHEATRQRARRRGNNDRPCETNNFAPVGDIQINDSARSTNAANSQCKNSGSNRSRWKYTVHKVRSYSGTPLASATPSSCEKNNNGEYVGRSTAKSIKGNDLAHWLSPMGEETLPMSHGVPERSKASSEQMRPYGTIRTPPLLPAPLAATTAANHQPNARADLAEAKSKKTDMQKLLTENGAETQDQRSSTKKHNPQSVHQSASTAARPPPEEIADLLLGIK